MTFNEYQALVPACHDPIKLTPADRQAELAELGESLFLLACHCEVRGITLHEVARFDADRRTALTLEDQP